MRTKPIPEKKSLDSKEAIDILVKADGGKAVREQVRQVFDEYPQLSELWGNLARTARGIVINLVANKDVLRQESLKAYLSHMQQRLAQPGDGVLERLLAERVVLAWLVLHEAETRRAIRWHGSIALSDAGFWDRHVSKLQSDFLRACRTLAVVRGLQRPGPLAQINIADKQQVNVVAGRTDPAG